MHRDPSFLVCHRVTVAPVLWKCEEYSNTMGLGINL